MTRRTIAIYGLNGSLSESVVNALLSNTSVASSIKYPLRLITHSDKQPFVSPKLEYHQLDDIEEALRDVDALVNLAGGTAPHDLVIGAAAKNKVGLYIPSQFGTDLAEVGKTFPGFVKLKTERSEKARNQGLKTVDICTGLFFDEKTGFAPDPVALDILGGNSKKQEITIIGDSKEKTQINPTFLCDIGSAVAAIVTRDDYNLLPDRVRIYSDIITYEDVIKHYETVTGVILTRKYLSTETALTEANERLSKGFSFADFSFYIDTLFALGEGKGIVWVEDNERETINPGQSLFKWTTYDSL